MASPPNFPSFSTCAFDPRRGWAEASRLRRRLAGTFLPGLLLSAALAFVTAEPAVAVLTVTVVYLLVLPGYHAARVLRPYRAAPPWWVVVRHVVAAFGGTFFLSGGLFALLGAAGVLPEESGEMLGIGFLYFVAVPAAGLGALSLVAWFLESLVRESRAERRQRPV